MQKTARLGSLLLLVLLFAERGAGRSHKNAVPFFAAHWSPDAFGTAITQVAAVSTFESARIYYKTFTPTPADLLACFKQKVDRTVFREQGGVKGVLGYIPEDLGDYYLHGQIQNTPSRITHSLRTADVVVINSLPMLSHGAGQCKGTSHASRQGEVFEWVEKNKRHLMLRPTLFSCTSWTCKVSVSPKNSLTLAEINATVLINELNGEWMPHTDSFTKCHAGHPECKWTGQMDKHNNKIFNPPAHELNVTRKHYGIPIPYSAHHSIPRPALVGAKTKQFLFIGSLRAEKVRSTLASVAEEPGVFLEVTGLTSTKKRKDKGRKHLVSSYANLTQSATFCFVPRGDTPSSRRLFDAIISGCLPVIISDAIDIHLPFSSTIPYDDFAFRIKEDDWIQDPKVVLQQLRTVSADELQQRRTIMAKFAPYIDWLAGENVLALIVSELLAGRQRLF